MSDLKLCFIDVETTGLDTKYNGVWQIAMKVYSGLHEGVFEFRCMPARSVEIEQKALDVSGMKKEDLTKFEPEPDMFNDFRKTLERFVDKYDRFDKFHFIGYNARFDMDFLWALFKRNHDKFFGSYFWFPPIDVMNMAAYDFMSIRSKFKDFKLCTVAEFLKIEIEESRLHDATYDIELTEKIYNLLVELRKTGRIPIPK